jgi:Rap1a immunity proteins
MKLLLVFAFLSAATACGGESGFPITDGNSLSEGLRLWKKLDAHGNLSSTEVASAFHAVGYLEGFLGGCGTWYALGSNTPFKLPKEGLGPQQFVKIVDKYLSDHPDRLHLMVDGLLFLALRDSFPNRDYIEPARP